ncbi:TPA: hypothetical protein RFX11_000587 [Klebsiella aerogenes]|nr:hypothetical protein [Klebsiella aerogenes]
MSNIKYHQIIATGDTTQFISWLKTLESQSRRTLAVLVKKDVKRLYTYKALDEKRGWGFEGTSEQLAMLGVATFCCYSREDYKKVLLQLLVDNDPITQILNWYCPDWFNDFVNYSLRKAKQNGYGFLRYEQISSWLDDGYLDSKALSDELIADTMRPEQQLLERYSFTLDEHIWLIFHYPPYLSTRWLEPFKVYTQNQRINRFRVLKESLQAVNRNFNREQTCWFATLFNELEPTIEECIQLQDELFAAFACPQSKPVSTALTVSKKLIDHPQFRVDEFTAQLPLLFASSSKGVITISLALADKIAAKSPKLRAEVSHYICGVFLNKDVGLQTKAAKLLAKYGDATDPELNALLMDYADNVLVAARELLTDFLDVQPAMIEAEEVFLQPLIREDNRIVEPQSWEDFVFLAGQAFLNQESWHFDLLPAAVLRFDSMVTEENVGQLEPAFAQAWKILGHECSFDGMLASFFLQYAGQLVERFPQQTKKILSFYEKHQQKVTGGERAPTLIWGLFAFQKEAKIRLRPWIEWLSWVLKHLKTHAGLPLLSTPTHSPCFIDPAILAERLYRYQQAGGEPCSQDVQLALQRCVFSTNAPSVDKLSGEYGALMRYMLSGDRHALAPISHDDWKLAAIITRSTAVPDAASTATASALLEKKSLPPELMSNIFPWHIAQKKNNYSGQEYTYQELHFTFADGWRQADGQLIYADSFMPCPADDTGWGVYKRRTLFSMPWQPDGTLMRFIAMNFRVAGIPNAAKSNLEILQALYDLPLPLTPMGHLLIALSLLHGDKTVRSLAGELWMDKCRRPDGVNSAVIGDALGRLEAQGWAPLKRFTDLAMQSLMGVSARHNAALLEMVSAMDSHLGGVKISNYKNLVELRQELTRM